MYLVYDSHLDIFAHCKVKIRFLDGRIRNINGVLHIPGLARNLLSIKKLIDAGVQVVFYDVRCKIVRCVMLIATGVRYGTLYKLDACTIECNNTYMKTNSIEYVRVSPSIDGHGFWIPKDSLYFE